MSKRGGYTLIELVLVLMLLVLIASLVFTLADAGSQSYLRLTAKQNQAADLRTALSYLDVQLRKHDTLEQLAVRPDPFNGEPALLITQTAGSQTFVTWIYLLDGYLCELTTLEGTAVSAAMGSRIAPLDDLDLEPVEQGALKITLTRQSPGQAIIRGSRTVVLRAGGVTP